jgi:pimeloyl-ACP methyl ester carboxylesterase
MSGLPPVLLIHGFASSFAHEWQRTGWEAILEGEGRRVLGVDLPGHGREPQDPARVTAVEAVLDATGDEPVDAVGFSAGGTALLAAAAQRPGAFRRLAILGVGWVPRLGPEVAERSGALARDLEADAEPDEPRSRIFRRLAFDAGNDPRMLARFLEAGGEPAPAEALGRLPTPALVVVGDEDFTGTGEELTSLLPHAQRLSLPGVDHFRLLGDVRCVDAVVAFLAA